MGLFSKYLEFSICRTVKLGDRDQKAHCTGLIRQSGLRGEFDREACIYGNAITLRAMRCTSRGTIHTSEFIRETGLAKVLAQFLIGVSFALYLVLFFLGSLGHAEQRELVGKGAEKIDAILLLDASGSMLQTDPDRLRDEGAKLFTKFLRDGDRLGIVQFEKNASVIRTLSPFKIDDATISQDIGKVSSNGLFTDLFSGIDEAAKILIKEGREDASKAIVLLSDGRMEPDPAIAGPYVRTEELLEKLLPELKARGIKVHTLALSEKSDRALLSEVAVATEGVTWFASDAQSIHQAFAELFLAVKQPQVVPLVGKTFSIDVDVQEATFYINRKDGAPLVLISPSGKVLREGDIPLDLANSIKWFHSQKFDVVTINAPETGDWQVQGVTDTDGFATVLTNLKLVSDWPATLVSDEPVVLQARLNDGTKPIVLKEVSGVTKYGIQIVPTDRVSEPVLEELLYDDGTHGDAIAGDGIFSYRVTLSEPGEYRAWIVAKGPTFDRRQQIPFQVKNPAITLKVIDASEEELASDHAVAGEHKNESHDAHGEHADHGGHEHDKQDSDITVHADGNKTQIIRALLGADLKLLRSAQVKLSVITQDRRRISLDMERNGEGNFDLPVSKFPIAGDFTLTATFKGITKKKVEIEEVSKSIKFSLKETVQGKEPEGIKDIVIEKKVETKPTNPTPFVLLSLVASLVGCGFFVWQAKSIQAGESFTLPEIPSLDLAFAGIGELEARVALNSISIDDPILKNEVIFPSIGGMQRDEAPKDEADTSSDLSTEEAVESQSPTEESVTVSEDEPSEESGEEVSETTEPEEEER